MVMRKWERVFRAGKNPDPIQASNIFKKWGLVPGASGFQFFFPALVFFGTCD